MAYSLILAEGAQGMYREVRFFDWGSGSRVKGVGNDEIRMSKEKPSSNDVNVRMGEMERH